MVLAESYRVSNRGSPAWSGAATGLVNGGGSSSIVYELIQWFTGKIQKFKLQKVWTPEL